MASILVIDDNSANLELMLYLLRAFGHAADGRSDGVSGFEVLRTGTYAIVLCDILMPGIDGYEFARRVRADETLRTMPLVAVTALAMPGDRERATAAGFDGYIGKPIEPTTFVKQVEVFLRGTR